MKKWILPVAVYLIVCIISVFLPASEGYDTIAWKLIVGQIYAIPALIVAILVMLYRNRRLSHS